MIRIKIISMTVHPENPSNYKSTMCTPTNSRFILSKNSKQAVKSPKHTRHTGFAKQ